MIPRYSKDGKSRLEILPQPVGDDFFDHIVLTDIENGTKIQLTDGRLTVTSIYGWNQEEGIM